MEVDNMAKDKPLEEFMQFNDGSGKALNCQENCLYGSGKAFLNFNDGSGKALKCRKNCLYGSGKA